KRAEWAAGLGVPLMSENPDADVLYWVGCMGSFDQRNKQVATSVAKILLAAGVNFAILGPEEWCTGDPARRIGNEYLWQMMAQQNVETLNNYGFNLANQGNSHNGHSNGEANVAPKHPIVITACPHCFNTIKNEYPQLGGNYEVMHHTQLLDELVRDGRLSLAGASLEERVTYHDSCYLGRHNDVYLAPRRVVGSLAGIDLVEMPRNG